MLQETHHMVDDLTIEQENSIRLTGDILPVLTTEKIEPDPKPSNIWVDALIQSTLNDHIGY